MRRFNFYIVFLAIISGSAGCGKLGSGILGKKSAKEEYEEKLEKIAPLQSTAWLRAGELALQNPLVVPVPYSEAGFIAGDQPDATAFAFSIKAGQQIDVSFKKITTSLPTTFLELWEVEGDNDRKLLIAADTLLNVIQHAAALPGNYVLRMQPQLGAKGSYALNILISPMLGFPIQADASPKIGSFWGAARDAGARKHEGIDIFAKKGSNVVAVLDGVISNVRETPIGGKVISLRPHGYPISVYYAHLDQQLVADGQQVIRGQVIGTVGNTGNAQHTAAHLHFGVYTPMGAVDPITFVQKVNVPQEPPHKNLNAWYKTSTKTKLYPSPARQNSFATTTPVKIKTQSLANNFYRVQLENGTKAFVPSAELTEKMKL